MLDKKPVRGHCVLVDSFRMNSSTLSDTTTVDDLHWAAITSLAIVNGLVLLGIVPALVLLLCPSTRKCRKTTKSADATSTTAPTPEETAPTPEETVKTADMVKTEFDEFIKSYKKSVFRVTVLACLCEAFFIGGSSSLYASLVAIAESLAGTNFLRPSDYDVLHTVQVIAFPACAVGTSLVALFLYYQDLRDFSTAQFDAMAKAIEAQTQFIKKGFAGLNTTLTETREELGDTRKELGDKLDSTRTDLQAAFDRMALLERKLDVESRKTRKVIASLQTSVVDSSEAIASSLSSHGAFLSDLDARATLVSNAQASSISDVDAQASSLTSVGYALQSSQLELASLKANLAALVSRLS